MNARPRSSPWRRKGRRAPTSTPRARPWPCAEGAASETAPFEAALAADPDDHQARFDLAGALAGQGRLEEAADHLLTIIGEDPAWNDQAARKQLLTVFEAAGFNSEVAKTGRRRLSSILFS